MNYQTPRDLLRNQHVNLFIPIRNIITKETRTFSLAGHYCLYLPEILSEGLNYFKSSFCETRVHLSLWFMVVCVCVFSPADLLIL